MAWDAWSRHCKDIEIESYAGYRCLRNAAISILLSGIERLIQTDHW